jgi:hypothetical protein
VIRRGRAHTPADESDHLHHRLLRARRQRPSGRRAASFIGRTFSIFDANSHPSHLKCDAHDAFGLGIE